MMKRTIAIILMLLGLVSVFAGCSTQLPTGEATASTETTPQKGSSLVEYDPDRTIYFLCQNSLDMYYSFPGYARFNFCILSKETLDLERIVVSVPTSHPYEVERNETKIPRATENMLPGQSNTMPFYVYEAYHGVDFPQQDQAVLDQAVSDALAAFKKLTAEDLPQMYRYDFLVLFDNATPYPEEEITHLDITIDGRLYQPEIGSIRLHAEENHPFDYPVRTKKYAMVQMHTLYNAGLIRYGLLEDLEATEDMVLTRVDFLGDHWQVLQIQITGTISGMNTNFIWDGETPIELYEGDRIQLSAVLHNPNFDDVFYQSLLKTVLTVEVDGERTGYCYNTLYVLLPNAYELYAIIFDGIDMEPYYRGYYYEKNELWRKPFLEQIGN